ncbi:MAG: Ig-like domain-containing protein [Gemmatimonadota bacterium]|nr:Ig-like domain-containing protein [Gemmatimonadota bacterium]
MFTSRLPTPLIGPGVILLSVILSTGCQDSTGTEKIDPADLTTIVESGDSLNGVRGSILPDSIVITVVDSRRRPVSDLTLEWQTLSAAGTVGVARTVTDMTGRSANVWTLGSATGAQQLEVSVVLGSKSTPLAIIHAESYPPAAEVRIEPIGHAFEVGETFKFGATARDDTGRVIPSYPVRWISSNPAAASVDQLGNVTAHQPAELVTITADALGVFKGVSVPVYQQINPSELTTTVVTGNSQNGIIGSALPDSIAVVVVDSRSKPVPGLTLEWLVLSAGGTVGVARTVTDTAGRSANVWTLGPTAGSQQLEVRAILRSGPAPLKLVRANSFPRAKSVRIAPYVTPINPYIRLTLEVGETVRFKAIVQDETGALIPDYPIKWTSDYPEVASIDQEGNLTAHHAAQYVTFRADALGTVGYSNVPIFDLTIRLSPDSLSLTSQNTVNVFAWVYDALGRDVSTYRREVIAMDSTIVRVQHCIGCGTAAYRSAIRYVSPLKSGETWLIAKTAMAADTIRVRVVLP